MKKLERLYNLNTAAEQARQLGLFAGDVIFKKSSGTVTDTQESWWEEERLTLLYIGKQHVIANSVWRNSENQTWRNEREIIVHTFGSHEWTLLEQKDLRDEKKETLLAGVKSWQSPSECNARENWLNGIPKAYREESQKLFDKPVVIYCSDELSAGGEPDWVVASTVTDWWFDTFNSEENALKFVQDLGLQLETFDPKIHGMYASMRKTIEK